jgi:hypothetical protein
LLPSVRTGNTEIPARMYARAASSTRGLAKLDLGGIPAALHRRHGHTQQSRNLGLSKPAVPDHLKYIAYFLGQPLNRFVKFGPLGQRLRPKTIDRFRWWAIWRVCVAVIMRRIAFRPKMMPSKVKERPANL